MLFIRISEHNYVRILRAYRPANSGSTSEQASIPCGLEEVKHVHYYGRIFIVSTAGKGLPNILCPFFHYRLTTAYSSAANLYASVYIFS